MAYKLSTETTVGWSIRLLPMFVWFCLVLFGFVFDNGEGGGGQTGVILMQFHSTLFILF